MPGDMGDTIICRMEVNSRYCLDIRILCSLLPSLAMDLFL